jgi:hypothetical protein
MTEAWRKICAAARGATPAVAVFLTTKEKHMQEKLQFAHFASGILERRRDSGAPCRALVTVSGDTLADALCSLAPPDEAVQILVISPHARDRGRLIAEAKTKWPLATAALDADRVEDGAYIVVDLRPCPIVDAGHVHSPVCMNLSQETVPATTASA